MKSNKLLLRKKYSFKNFVERYRVVKNDDYDQYTIIFKNIFDR